MSNAIMAQMARASRKKELSHECLWRNQLNTLSQLRDMQADIQGLKWEIGAMKQDSSQLSSTISQERKYRNAMRRRQQRRDRLKGWLCWAGTLAWASVMVILSCSDIIDPIDGLRIGTAGALIGLSATGYFFGRSASYV